jgi:hypothetical protein
VIYATIPQHCVTRLPTKRTTFEPLNSYTKKSNQNEQSSLCNRSYPDHLMGVGIFRPEPGQCNSHSAGNSSRCNFTAADQRQQSILKIK